MRTSRRARELTQLMVLAPPPRKLPTHRAQRELRTDDLRIRGRRRILFALTVGTEKYSIYAHMPADAPCA